jgi:cyanuric acid amidohydrolase
MRVAAVHKLAMADPGDTSGADGLDLRDAVAVVGKTEGNGCVNDFTRGIAARAWREALGSHVVTVMSGGTEGVLSPHALVISEIDEDPGAPAGALLVAVGSSDPIAPAALGREAQARAVAASVRELCRTSGIPVGEVQLVLVKCPLLIGNGIPSGAPPPITTDGYESMSRSRAASALGVALALGEIDEAGLAAGLAGDRNVHSAVASTSAGVEVDRCEIVVLGHSPGARGRLRASHGVMADALDTTWVRTTLDAIAGAGGRVLHVLAKAEPAPTGHIRGRRHTMLTDSDLQPTRHARAAVGGLLAGLSGDPAIYVSGGAEHQGPPGGGPVAILWELAP